MKKTDVTILSHLRQNGRIPLTKLSRKTGLPVSTLHDRLKNHITKGLLQPNILLRFEKIGFNTRAQIMLSVHQNEKEQISTYLKQHSNVNSLYRINNGWNIMMECVFKDMHAMEDFVEQLEANYNIKKKEVHYVLDELKREAFLAQPELAEAIIESNI